MECKCCCGVGKVERLLGWYDCPECKGSGKSPPVKKDGECSQCHKMQGIKQ